MSRDATPEQREELHAARVQLWLMLSRSIDVPINRIHDVKLRNQLRLSMERIMELGFFAGMDLRKIQLDGELPNSTEELKKLLDEITR